MYCANCGSPLGNSAQFCSRCGGAAGATLEFTVPRAPTPQPLYCPSCGTYREDGERFCGACGAPPVHAQAPVHAPAATTPRGRVRLSNRTMAVAAVVAVLAVAGGVAAFVTLSRSSTPSAGTAQSTTSAAERVSVAQQAAAIESPVRAAQQSFVSDALSMSATDASLAGLERAAQSFSAAVTNARTGSDAINAASGSDRAVAASLQQLLSAQASLCAALGNLPSSLSDVDPTQIATVQRQADAVNTAATAFGKLAPAAQPPAISSSTWTKLVKAVADRAHDDQVRTFVVKMENLLSQSADGRSQLLSALTQTQNHCAISPDQAAQQFRDVAGNRQSLLDQASALTVPADASARDVLNLFQQALRHSIAADNAFAAWMNYLYNYYYEYPIGCPGDVPTDSNYQQAVNESGYATHAKTELVAAFNRLARTYGLRANWTAGQI